MTRNTTRIKEQKVLKEFFRLLRSGKDYSTRYMYEEAGKIGFIAGKSAGNMVRKYYKGEINNEMELYVEALGDTPHDVKVDLFAKRFNVCIRESRLMIRYIKRNNIIKNLHD